MEQTQNPYREEVIPTARPMSALFAERFHTLAKEKAKEPEKPKRGGINSDRALAILELMELMREHLATPEERAMPGEEGKAAFKKRYNTRFKYWLGRTRHLTSSAVWMNIAIAKRGRNPGALFNTLLKKKEDTPAV